MNYEIVFLGIGYAICFGLMAYWGIKMVDKK
jgi:hypothetical protein